MGKWFLTLRNNITGLAFILLFLIQPVYVHGKEKKNNNWSFNGYITDMESYTFQDLEDDWISDGLLHNRLNFKYLSNSGVFGLTFELRNRIMSEESFTQFPGYEESLIKDKGLFDLSYNLISGTVFDPRSKYKRKFVWNSKVDRLYFDLNLDKLQVRVGRQRINWGQCMVWNPNDLFNVYSFFDVDYPERPGSDAIRLQYYTGETSHVEFAVKADYLKRITAAGLYRFNVLNYDIQVLGGIMDGNDLVVGGGWSGNIGGASFTGEVSYFYPKTAFSDTTGVVTASIGSMYTFSNSFTLEAEVLYNQKKIAMNSFANYLVQNISAKSLSFSKFSMMLQGSYPITPLFNATLAGMYFPDLKAYFVGPTLTYSITDNMDFSVIGQTFTGKFMTDTNQTINMLYLRLKYNF